jgi:hypothetical protein
MHKTRTDLLASMAIWVKNNLEYAGWLNREIDGTSTIPAANPQGLRLIPVETLIEGASRN